jgi:hypothetical protein
LRSAGMNEEELVVMAEQDAALAALVPGCLEAAARALGEDRMLAVFAGWRVSAMGTPD